MSIRTQLLDRTGLFAGGGLLVGLPPIVVCICVLIVWTILPMVVIVFAVISATPSQRVQIARSYLPRVRPVAPPNLSRASKGTSASDDCVSDLTAVRDAIRSCHGID